MEGGAEHLGDEIVGLLETAYEKHQSRREIRKKLDKMSETLAETMPFSKYAEAFVKGMLLAVQSRATSEVFIIQNTIDAVFDRYGPILVTYANTKTIQIQVIESVEKICLEPQSPFFPLFGYIIQTLSRHCVNVESIGDWKGRRLAAHEQGTLSPREIQLLRNMEDTRIGPEGNILAGFDLGKAGEDSRDMGF